MNKQLKLKSFGALAKINDPKCGTPEKWENFLKEKGHTQESFDILPDNLQLSLKMSFL